MLLMMSKDMSNTTNANNLKKTKSHTLDTPFHDLQFIHLGVGISEFTCPTIVYNVLFAFSPLHDYHNLNIIQCLLELFFPGGSMS